MGSHLSPDDDTIWDISPNSLGNVDDDTYPTDFSDFTNFYNYYNGGDTSQGYSLNPVTNQSYEVQNVKRGDYARVLAGIGQMGLILKLHLVTGLFY